MTDENAQANPEPPESAPEAVGPAEGAATTAEPGVSGASLGSGSGMVGDRREATS